MRHLIIVSGLALCLAACGAEHPNSSGGQTFVTPVAPPMGSVSPMPAPANLAAPSSAGFSVAALQADALCIGADGAGNVRLTSCTSPFILRFRLAGGRWREANGQCLDFAGGSTAAGTQLALAPCAPGSKPSQNFSIDGDGYLMPVPATGKPTQCIFAGVGATQGKAASLLAGAPLTVGTCTSASLQWLVAPEGMTLRPGSDSTQCLQGSTPQVGSNAIVTNCNGSPEQLWTLVGNQLRLQKAPTLCLDVNKNVDFGGSQVDLWGCGPASAEIFSLSGLDQSIHLQSRPNLCVQEFDGGAVGMDTCAPQTLWNLQAP